MQLPIPGAPKLDRFGMHDLDCECGRCALGYRPSIADRHHARMAWERLEAKRKAEAERAAKGLPKEEKRKRKAAAVREAEAYTDQLIRNLQKPVERPATPEELAALKAEYPNLKRRPP